MAGKRAAEERPASWRAVIAGSSLVEPSEGRVPIPAVVAAGWLCQGGQSGPQAALTLAVVGCRAELV